MKRTISIFFILPIILTPFCTHRFTYEDARKRDTVGAYYRFIVENPDAEEVDIARERIRDLLFRSCIETRDILLIKRFISEFPQDPRSQRLRDLLDEIRFQRAKVEGGIEPLKTYLLNNPEGRFRDEAKGLIEEYEYKRVVNSDRPEDIEDCLKRYPDMRYKEELQSRLIKIYFERINSNDLRSAKDFLLLFPDSNYKDAAIKIILDEHIKRSTEYCIPPIFYSEMLEDLKRDGVSPEIIDSFHKGATKEEELCQGYIDQLSLLARGRLTDPSVVKKEDIAYLKSSVDVFKAYYSTLAYIRDLNRRIDLEGPAVRLNILNRLKDFPFLPETLSTIISLYFGSTIYERLVIADILIASSKIDTNRYLLEQFFFFRRNQKIYEVLSHKVLSDPMDFERLNSFYNRAFSDSKDDVVHQFFILLSAYETGHNIFIRSNISDHLKHLFSLTSSIQSMCHDGCPQKVYFDLKGLNRILTDEIRISLSVFKEDSDIFRVLLEKQREIEKIINSHKDPETVLEPPPRVPPYNTSIYKRLIKRSVLKIIYFLEPDRERRDQILDMMR